MTKEELLQSIEPGMDITEDFIKLVYGYAYTDKGYPADVALKLGTDGERFLKEYSTYVDKPKDEQSEKHRSAADRQKSYAEKSGKSVSYQKKLLENIEALTEADFCGTELYDELFAITSKIERSDKELEILIAAKKLGLKKIADEKIKVREQEITKKEQAFATTHPISNIEQVTSFESDKDEKNYPQMFCGNYHASDDGIFTLDNNGNAKFICYHPILPIRRLINIETAEEQIVLAFKRDNRWKEIIAPKMQTSSARNIVELSQYGVNVTSENARKLVQYLSDLEMWNADLISVQNSTGKLGWHGGYFVPYDEKIMFDGEAQFRDLYKSISESGDYHTWVTLMRELRASGSIEPRVALAASFASALIKPLGVLPFIVDFYGQTEGGKTVTINLAASVWGNPAPGCFVGNFRATDTAIETRADMLNNFPMILDDSKNASNYVIKNYESLIYNLCAGKGKARSNKKLGAAKENTWQNVTICNGESPISEHISSGGAVNRILEVSCSEQIYENPVRVSNIIAKNYGHAGMIFVENLKKYNRSDLQARLAEIEKKFDQTKFAQKQIMAAAVVILADELATEYLFEDGRALTVEDMKTIIANKQTVFEGQRCYEFILEALEQYARHFNPSENVDQWGPPRDKDCHGKQWAYFLKSVLENLLNENGYSLKAFIMWAEKRKLIKQAAGRKDGTCTKCIGDKKTVRVVAIQIIDPAELDGEQFHQESLSEDIPFD